MANISCKIIGKKVIRARQVHDYYQLLFDDGSVLNILNNFIVSGNMEYNITQFIGSVVTSINNTGCPAIEIRFSDGKWIRIGISENDYNGPEAMEYIDNNGIFTVWR